MWFSSTMLFAQDIDQDIEDDPDLLENTNSSTFVLGEGLNLNMNQGDYSFKLSGFLQPSYHYEQLQPDTTGSNYLYVGAARINLEGHALKEKVSFFIEADFVNSFSLYEAWGAYHFNDKMTLYVGQKRTFTNDREYTVNESRLSMVTRSALSNAFTTNGREFGLFFTSTFDIGNMVLKPQIAITSGDGMNSFGNNSIDNDKGGMKYGGRLDFLPLGEFTGTDGCKRVADLEREKSPKVAIGGTFSYNMGASNQTGDGHGDFELYNGSGDEEYANYVKFYVDVLAKYQGFSFLAEFVNSSAQSKDDLYTSNQAVIRFTGEEVSSKYVLGMAYNAQLGYVFENGWGLDARYTGLIPEYEDYENSILKKEDWYTFGISKYLKEDALKIQASGSFVDGKDTMNPYTNETITNDRIEARLVAQIIF